MLTGFPPATTLLFSGVGTLLFLVDHRQPAAELPRLELRVHRTGHRGGRRHGIRQRAGRHRRWPALLLAIVGAVVHVVGARWIDRRLPPVVTGAIVALIGLNLAPAAKTNFDQGPADSPSSPWSARHRGQRAFRGMLGRLASSSRCPGGLRAGADPRRGRLLQASTARAWVGSADFQTPAFHLGVVGLFLPVVLVLVAENIGHVKSVGQ